MISTGCSNASQSIGAMGSYGVETMQASGADRAQGEGSPLQPPDSIARGCRWRVQTELPHGCPTKTGLLERP